MMTVVKEPFYLSVGRRTPKANRPATALHGDVQCDMENNSCIIFFAVGKKMGSSAKVPANVMFNSLITYN